MVMCMRMFFIVAEVKKWSRKHSEYKDGKN